MSEVIQSDTLEFIYFLTRIYRVETNEEHLPLLWGNVDEVIIKLYSMYTHLRMSTI